MSHHWRETPTIGRRGRGGEGWREEEVGEGQRERGERREGKEK